MFATSAAREWLTHGISTSHAVGLIGLGSGAVAVLRGRSGIWGIRAMLAVGVLVWIATLGLWSIPLSAAAAAVFCFRRSDAARPTWAVTLAVVALATPLFLAKLWIARTGQSVPSGALLPIGLSYLTFALIGAVIDEVRPSGPEVTAQTFVLWISHPGARLAGPVTRLDTTAKRLARPDTTSGTRLADGAWWIGLALLKKRFISDVLVAVALRGGLPTSRWLVGPYLVVSAVVVYFDATAYSDFAVGVGRWCGLDLPQSFARPVTRASDLPDLWRRWQVPLMAWFRDYVYGPLRSVIGATAALAVAFSVSALWHGLTLVWLCWGAVTVVMMICWTRLCRPTARHRWIGKLMVAGYLIGLAGIVQLGRTSSLTGIGHARWPWLWIAGAVAGVASVIFFEQGPILRRPFGGRGSLIWLAAIVVAALAARWPFLPFVYQLF